MKIQVNIDRLVLNGFSDATTAAGFDKIIGAELAMIIRREGLPGGGGRGIELQDKNLLTVRNSNDPVSAADGGGSSNNNALGANIARSVYRSLGAIK